MGLSGKSIPIIFLIFVPSYIGICYYIHGYILYSSYSTGHQFNVHSSYFLYLALKSAQSCYAIIIAYGLSPIGTSAKYTNKDGYEKIVIEYEFIKKILFIAMPILIISLTYQFRESPYITYGYLSSYGLVEAIFASSLAIAIGAIIRIATQIAKKNFRFYLANGYCTLASKSRDLDRMKYLSLSLDSYNKHLLRKTNLGIKNINKIYSLLVPILRKKMK